MDKFTCSFIHISKVPDANADPINQHQNLDMDKELYPH